MQDQIGFILDNPFDPLPFGELHGLSQGGRKVNVPLLTFFASRRMSCTLVGKPIREYLLVSSYMTRYKDKPEP